MEKSTWLEKYENEVKSVQEKRKSSKGGVIVVAIFFVGILVLAMVNGRNSEVDVTPYIIGMAVVFALILLLIIVSSKKGGTRDAAKGVRENLEQLLTTSEQVAEFDAEMLASPRCEYEVDTNESVIFTEHYIATKFNNLGIQDYRFARISEIAKNDFAKTRNQAKAYGMGILYMVDLQDVNGKKLLGINVAGKKKMDEFEQLLTKYCPGIQLKEHKVF